MESRKPATNTSSDRTQCSQNIYERGVKLEQLRQKPVRHPSYMTKEHTVCSLSIPTIIRETDTECTIRRPAEHEKHVMSSG